MKDGDGSGGSRLSLEFLKEAALIVGLDGEIHGANSAARRLFGPGISTAKIFDHVQEPAKVAQYLRHAATSTSSRVGALTLATDAGDHFRTLAARLQTGGAGGVQLILRILPAEVDQFGDLNRQLADLNAHLHLRLKENAALQEALSENKVLLREIQHRVKNNIQQMLSLIKMSARGRTSPDAIEIVEAASHRLHAMAATQEALYRDASLGSISVRSFLDDVVRTTSVSYGVTDRLTVSIDEGKVTSLEAHCLALIANELVTNACKHATAGGGRIMVNFTAERDGYCLEVRDEGPGLDLVTVSRSSGLAIVRGLCRQIGGAFKVRNEHGTRCLVHFRSNVTEER